MHIRNWGHQTRTGHWAQGLEIAGLQYSRWHRSWPRSPPSMVLIPVHSSSDIISFFLSLSCFLLLKRERMKKQDGCCLLVCFCPSNRGRCMWAGNLHTVPRGAPSFVSLAACPPLERRKGWNRKTLSGGSHSPGTLNYQLFPEYRIPFFGIYVHTTWSAWVLPSAHSHLKNFCSFSRQS